MLPIKGYEDCYTIADTGVVTNIRTGRVLKSSLNKTTGYLYVTLCRQGVNKTKSVHRLVALHFIPPVEGKPFVNHKDSDRTNPTKDNLEWCTQSENLLHGYAVGFMVARRNFDEIELSALLNALLAGETMTALAAKEGVGLTRLTLNLRKWAGKRGLSDEFAKELSEQKRLRNTDANINKRKPIHQWWPDGTWVAKHASATAAAKAVGGSSSGSICNALDPTKSQQRAFGFLWTYA